MSYAHLSSVEATHIGRKRTNNEDAALLLPAHGVFCVADGMGGAAHGEVASRATIDSLQLAFSDLPGPAPGLSAKADLVNSGLNDASRWIHGKATAEGVGSMGTTVVVLVLDATAPDRALIVHAGDSRAYCFRDGKLSQVTRDHSVAEQAGVADERDLPAMFHGVITNAVGVKDTVEAERTETDVREGDVFMLCTDGLTRMVSDGTLTEILASHAGGDLQETADAMIDAANNAGGVDNITLVLVRVGPLPTPVEVADSARDTEEPTPDTDEPRATSVTPVSAGDRVRLLLRGIPVHRLVLTVTLLACAILLAIGGAVWFRRTQRLRHEQIRRDEFHTAALRKAEREELIVVASAVAERREKERQAEAELLAAAERERQRRLDLERSEQERLAAATAEVEAQAEAEAELTRAKEEAERARMEAEKREKERQAELARLDDEERSDRDFETVSVEIGDKVRATLETGGWGELAREVAPWARRGDLFANDREAERLFRDWTAEWHGAEKGDPLPQSRYAALQKLYGELRERAALDLSPRDDAMAGGTPAERASRLCSLTHSHQRAIADAMGSTVRSFMDQSRAFGQSPEPTFVAAWAFTYHMNSEHAKSVSDNALAVLTDIQRLKKWVDTIGEGPADIAVIESCPVALVASIQRQADAVYEELWNMIEQVDDACSIRSTRHDVADDPAMMDRLYHVAALHRRIVIDRRRYAKVSDWRAKANHSDIAELMLALETTYRAAGD